MANFEYDYILCRFGELTTKGKNRREFINSLLTNIKKRLKSFDKLTYIKTHDAIFITLNGEDFDEVILKLKTVYGLSNFSGAIKCKRDLEDVQEKAMTLINKTKAKTFKVKAKRSDKNFPKNSDMINREIASYILKNTDLKVDVHNPDLILYITVKNDCIYLMDDKIEAIGGYPVGVNGRCLLMMSGGIDSPVAASMMMKRGIKVECIHFASMPYTSKQALDKVLDLVKILTAYQAEIRVHIVPFTDLQVAIYEHTDESYAITLLRRMMYRIASKVCDKRHLEMIANGESIGQVASQTPESMKVISEVTDKLIIRPLACLDKLEIINMAKDLDTYKTSILPYEDCCTIFSPKNPVTKPKSEKCLKFEGRFDYETLIDECVANIETVLIKSEEENDELF